MFTRCAAALLSYNTVNIYLSYNWTADSTGLTRDFLVYHFPAEEDRKKKKENVVAIESSRRRRESEKWERHTQVDTGIFLFFFLSQNEIESNEKFKAVASI
jgi:hypothetical protein